MPGPPKPCPLVLSGGPDSAGRSPASISGPGYGPRHRRSGGLSRPPTGSRCPLAKRASWRSDSRTPAVARPLLPGETHAPAAHVRSGAVHSPWGGHRPYAATRKLYRSQALAAQITTAAEDLTTALRRITAQETMLPFAARLRRLILAFHASVSRFKCLWLKPLCPAGQSRPARHPAINGAAETNSEPEGVKYRQSLFLARGRSSTLRPKCQKGRKSRVTFHLPRPSEGRGLG